MAVRETDIPEVLGSIDAKLVDIVDVVVVFTAVVVVSAIALVVEISCVTMGTSKTIKCDILVLVPTSLKLISISSSIFGLTTNSLPVGAEKKLLSVRWFWFFCCDAVFCTFFGAESVSGFFFCPLLSFRLGIPAIRNTDYNLRKIFASLFLCNSHHNDRHRL